MNESIGGLIAGLAFSITLIVLIIAVIRPPRQRRGPAPRTDADAGSSPDLEGLGRYWGER